MNHQIREILDAQPWEEHLKMLTAFALALLRQLVWRGVAGASVPGGLEAADFAMEAICDVYSGSRKWDPDTHPDLGAHLRWVVRSKISNTVRSAGNRLEIREGDLSEESPAADLPDEEFAWGFLQKLEAEPHLYKIAECIIDGAITRREIARRLGLKPEEVTNARKQLARRLSDYKRTINANPGKAGGRK